MTGYGYNKDDGKPPTRSQLRTLITRGNEGLRVAKDICDGIKVVLDVQERGTQQHSVAQFCFNTASKICDRVEAEVKQLKAQRKIVGGYPERKKDKPQEKS